MSEQVLHARTVTLNVSLTILFRETKDESLIAGSWENPEKFEKREEKKKCEEEKKYAILESLSEEIYRLAEISWDFYIPNQGGKFSLALFLFLWK